MPIRAPLATGAPLVSATFVARVHQLIIEARLDETIVRAHIGDRAQLLDMLYPGSRLLLAPRTEIGRKTAFQVVAAQVGNELVSLDTQLPHRLIAAALATNALPQFARYPRVQADVMVGTQQFDFRLGEGLASCLLAVKSVGHMAAGVALFPNIPSERDRQQLETLIALAQKGQRAALLFVVQRSFARAFAPHEAIEPQFAQAFRQALAIGVEIYAYRCPVMPEGITLGEGIPIFGSLASVPVEYQESVSRT